MVRLAKVLVAAPFRARLDWQGISVVTFRVWPNDVDLNLHMNNGRYLTLMDLGRFDYIARLGLARAVRRRRWLPLVGAATMRFRRSLPPWRRYQLETRLLGWDAKWFYLEQRFVRGGDVAAVGWVRALFRGPHGNVPSADVMREVGVVARTPPLPREVTAWAKAMDGTSGRTATPRPARKGGGRRGRRPGPRASG
jgi:acyl-CoA thioesterase FadM